MKPSQFPFHSILLSVYPVVFLLARNIPVIPLEQSIRPLAITIGIAIILLFGLQVILKDWGKAGVICSLVMILLLSFGHAANIIGEWITKTNIHVSIHHLAWVWLSLFLGFTFIVLKWRFPDNFTRYLNVFSALILIFPLAAVIFNTTSTYQNGRYQSEILSQMRGQAQAELAISELSPDELPDIYYIILDGYERADKLKAYYDYDNSYFTAALEERGFYIAGSSRSNYLSTSYSLNTAMNLIYFHEFPKNLFVKSRYNLQTNYVSDFLRHKNYQVIVFESGTGDTDKQYADEYVAPERTITAEKPLINTFEQLLIRTTMWILLLNQDPLTGNLEPAGNAISASINRELDLRRERVKHALAHLPGYASNESNYFLFSHIYLPHYPFLFGPNGEELEYHQNSNLYWYETAHEDYIEYYTYQITYLNKLLLETIDRILEVSEKPVVIVLQSDHGDEYFLDWDAPTAQGVDIRSANLNAIYFSDGAYETLYPTLTQVNTFRLILNHWFGTSYPLLPDKVFVSTHPTSTAPSAKPKFIDGCPEFNICPPKQ